MPDAIRFAAIDEHPLFRQGLVQSLQRSGELVCIAEGETAADARRIASLEKPDILILEVVIRGGGIQAARAILSAHPQTKIMILTASDDESHVLKALRAGVHGYVLKGVSGGELIRAIKGVHAGEPYVTPALASLLLMSSRSPPLPPVNKSPDLSHREQQVLAGLCKGLTDKEIATNLNISPSTIRYYVGHIFRKLNVRNRVQALRVSTELLKGKV